MSKCSLEKSFFGKTKSRVVFAAGQDLNNEDQPENSYDKKDEEASDSDSETSNTMVGGSFLAGALLLATIAAVGGAGFVYKEQLFTFISYFETVVEGLGPQGYALFVLGYAILEMLAIPAVPLTMSAGLLFGVTTGTALVSMAGTVAATGAFLIARYAIRDRVYNLVKENKKFVAIDNAIGDDSFRVVLFLRLSPLLPFSIGNYIYGITSVKLLPYVLASWLGMLPGTWAYVSAGSLGRTLLESDGQAGFQGGSQLLTLGLGLVATVGAATYVTRVAKKAIKNLDD